MERGTCPCCGAPAIFTHGDEGTNAVLYDVDPERIARVLAEHVSGYTMRGDEPASVSRADRDLAQYIADSLRGD